jgi:DNA-binding LacI/PurR family transcriptional regulator
MAQRHAASSSGRPRVTMRDIAELAGVSRTTVSHALSGHGRVDVSTRRRIREIADELGFVPSPTALALKTGRTGVLAIVNATTGGSLEYFMLAASAASHTALEAGYALALVPPERQDTWVAQLPMDGALVLDPLDDDPIMSALRGRGSPVVTIGNAPASSGRNEPTIRTDRTAGTDAVLDHLHEQGAQRPALIIDRERRRWILETRDAYSRWMRTHDLEPVIVDAHGESPERAGYDAAREMLRHPGVDAAYVPFDPLAGGVLTALDDLQMRIPQDFRIVSQEGIRARTGRPKLTALDDRPDEAARLAMQMLIERITNPDAPARTMLVQPHLIVRETT